MAPIYRKGDVIVVSPTAAIRKGDRVVVKTKGGEAIACELKRKTGKGVQIVLFTPGHRDRKLSNSEVQWIARIVWSSQ